MALVTDKSMGKALAELFRHEMEESLNRQVHLLSKLHWGDCDGDPCSICESLKPPPPTRRERARRWVSWNLWARPWGFVHRVLPGECSHEDCGEW